MRFGIMAMQLNMLVPPGLPAEKLLAHVGGFDHAGLVSTLAGNGFDPIELGGDLVMFMPHTFQPESIERLRESRARTGLGFTLHLPLWSVDPSTPLSPVRQGSVRALVESIQATRSLEPEVCVLHATGSLAAEFYRMRLPELARQVLLRQFQDGARQSLRAILAETGLPARKLAIETVEFPFDLTLELAEELDLSICLDTGHVLAGFSGPVGLFEALERCLPRLAEIHLHDAPWQGPEGKLGYGQDHRPLGTGDLDVPRFLERLNQAGFAGPLVFELRLEEALASMDYLRSHCPNLL
jgi:sugar phosphate isomerase/epimerase